MVASTHCAVPWKKAHAKMLSHGCVGFVFCFFSDTFIRWKYCKKKKKTESEFRLHCFHHSLTRWPLTSSGFVVVDENCYGFSPLCKHQISLVSSMTPSPLRVHGLPNWKGILIEELSLSTLMSTLMSTVWLCIDFWSVAFSNYIDTRVEFCPQLLRSSWEQCANPKAVVAICH